MMAIMVIPSDSFAQRKKSKKNKKTEQTSAKPKKNPNDYSNFVNKSTKTDDGLFHVHETKGKYYFEIPEDMFGKELLLVTRLREIPANLGGRICKCRY